MTVDIVFGWSIFDIAIDGNGNGSGCGGSASRVFFAGPNGGGVLHSNVAQMEA